MFNWDSNPGPLDRIERATDFTTLRQNVKQVIWTLLEVEGSRYRLGAAKIAKTFGYKSVGSWCPQ